MKLSIVGRGIRPLEHLTLAGVRALKSADVVFGIEPDVAAWAILTEEFDLPGIERLDFLYKDGRTDKENYEAFFAFIQDLVGLYEHVALVVAGHPRLGVSIAQWLSSPAFTARVELEFIEGISSFDTMFNELGVDPLERGTAVLDANRLLLFKYELETAVDTFIYHPSSVGNSRTDYVDCTARNQVQHLMNYLLKFYSPEKTVVLCKAANFIGQASEYMPLKLAELVSHSRHIDMGSTLYIPADKPTAICQNFLSKLRSGHDSVENYCF